ncbi:LysR substrate-binding domain-containing protein [Micromonospora tarensis]|uniref:LysR substrate-binding domain-containing protein n=1 Tax=Micromonospora tarensis TaxID=2806100 RepID=UPI002815F24E|nr:LysR substrate-binding domain-containing protein [Micromonospora tarensis]
MLLSADHPLADAEQLRPADLRDSTLWTPAPLHRLDFLHRFADRFGIQRHTAGTNLGLDQVLAYIADHPECFYLLPADGPPPAVPGVRSVPLVEPTPLYAWSLLWRPGSTHPALPALVHAFTQEARRRRWLEYDRHRDWLPVEPT